MKKAKIRFGRTKNLLNVRMINSYFTPFIFLLHQPYYEMTSTVIKIAVGSTNRVKIDAARFAFEKAMNVIYSSSSTAITSTPSSSSSLLSPVTVETITNVTTTTVTTETGTLTNDPLSTSLPPRIETFGFSTQSGVSDQPMSNVETRTGAVNRAINAAVAYYTVHQCYPDFAVGLEGGCEEDTWNLPVFDPKRTMPSTPTIPSSSLPSTTINDLICYAWMVVYSPKTGQWGYARTGTFSLPPPVAALVRQGIELGTADDMVFKRTNSKQEDGAVGLLSRGLINRTGYYDHAMILALIPFIRNEYYSSSSPKE